MPWDEATRMTQRARFVLALADSRYTMTELCERYGISRKTGYKWLERYEHGGPAVHSGLVMRGLPAVAGRITPAQLREVFDGLERLRLRGGDPAAVPRHEVVRPRDELLDDRQRCVGDDQRRIAEVHAPAVRRLRHDLRNAFNELRLCVEVLRIETDPAEIARWLELIEGAAEHCDKVIVDMEPYSQ